MRTCVFEITIKIITIFGDCVLAGRYPMVEGRSKLVTTDDDEAPPETVPGFPILNQKHSQITLQRYGFKGVRVFTQLSLCLMAAFSLNSFSTPIGYCSEPHFSGEEELYTQLVFFLLSQFWPIDIFIVENCEWYH